MVTVIAQYRTHAGKGDEVAFVLARHVTATRAEPGCIAFTAYRSEDDPDRFTLHEQYVDEDAFQAHRQTPHFRANVEEAIAPLLLERTWQRLRELTPA